MAERAVLLSEIDRVRRQDLSPTETLLQRYLECKTERIPSQNVGMSIARLARRDRLMALPSDLLPWLG